MLKQEQRKVADSNIENYGSKEHHDLRKAAAETEEEWKGAGQKPGLEVWRIESFGVKRWPTKNYGTFYQGDSYIVLFTYRKKDPATGKDSDKLVHDLHFWLGKDTTQDEYGTAAYKTVELDDLLGGVPVQYREVQGCETAEFRKLFPKMKLLEGGVDSAFNQVKPEEYRPRLLHVKGKEYVLVKQVPLKTKSLNVGDCFILDAGLKLFQWNGPESNHFERRKALETVNQIKEERNGRPQATVIDGLDDHKEFWTYFGGKPEKLSPATPDDDIYPPCKVLYRLSDASGKLQFHKVAEGADIERKQLDSNDVFIFDVGVTVYAWVGSGASPEERKKAMQYAIQYLNDNDRPVATPLIRVIEGGEPRAFEEAFTGPPREAKSAARREATKTAAAAGPREGAIITTIIGARNLEKVQLIGKQDPYAVIRLGKEKHITRVHADGGDHATWNQVFKWSISEGDECFELIVKDENVLLDAEIGRATIPLAEVASHGESEHKRTVTIARRGETAGEVDMVFRYVKPVTVQVVEARNLEDVEILGKQDPYVIVQLDLVKYTGPHIDNAGKNPKWKAEENIFKFNFVLYEEAEGANVDIELKDKNVTFDRHIARTSIPVNTLNAARGKGPKWYPLQREGKPSGEVCINVV